MSLFRHVFVAGALVWLVAGGPALAQNPTPSAGSPPVQSAKPSGSLADTARKDWDGISTMTRRQWNSMKTRWALEKAKWAGCNRDARAQKLSTKERWTAVGKCMMR